MKENYDEIKKNMKGVVSYEAYSNDVIRGKQPICLEAGKRERGTRTQNIYGNGKATQTEKGTTEINHSDNEQGGFSIPKGFMSWENDNYRKNKRNLL